MLQKNRFYAIRHKPTGFFLPTINSRSGSTQVNPKEGCVPRLFTDELNARKTLNIWLKGSWKYEEGGWLNLPLKKVIEERPERKPEEMEIIEVTIVRNKLSS